MRTATALATLVCCYIALTAAATKLNNAYPVTLNVDSDEWEYLFMEVKGSEFHKDNIVATRIYVQIYDVTTTFVADTYYITANNATKPKSSDIPLGVIGAGGDRAGFVTVYEDERVMSLGIHADCNNVCQDVTATVAATIYHDDPDFGSNPAPIKLRDGETTVMLQVSQDGTLHAFFELKEREKVYIVMHLENDEDVMGVSVLAGDESTASSETYDYNSEKVDRDGYVRSGKMKLDAGTHSVAFYGVSAAAGGSAPIEFEVTLGIGYDPYPKPKSAGFTVAMVLLALFGLALIVGGVGYYLYLQKENSNAGGGGGGANKTPVGVTSANNNNNNNNNNKAGGKREEAEFTAISMTTENSSRPAAIPSPHGDAEELRAAKEKIKALEEQVAKLRKIIHDSRHGGAHGDEGENTSDDVSELTSDAFFAA